MIVEIFKTDIGDKYTAQTVINSLEVALPQYKFNFDLDDRDKVLRVESSRDDIKTEIIKNQVITKGFVCELIDY